MINIAMILGGAAIGGAIGLLGRYHDQNMCKEEFDKFQKLYLKLENV